MRGEAHGSRASRRSLRGGLAVLAVTPAWIGAWALIAPHSFYRSFPGGGHRWVAALGAYDQHLVRDIGALELGMLFLLIAAAALLERTLVRVTLLAYAIASTPHLAYHLTTLGRFSVADDAATVAGLALQVVLPLALLATTSRAAVPEPGLASHAAAGRGTA